MTQRDMLRFLSRSSLDPYLWEHLEYLTSVGRNVVQMYNAKPTHPPSFHFWALSFPVKKIKIIVLRLFFKTNNKSVTSLGSIISNDKTEKCESLFHIKNPETFKSIWVNDARNQQRLANRVVTSGIWCHHGIEPCRPSKWKTFAGIFFY